MTMKRGYLSRPDKKLRQARILDLVVFLDHIYRAAESPDIGWSDTQRTLDTMVAPLNRKLLLSTDVIQSALWACNMLNEQGLFQHPRGLTYDQFVKRFLLPGEKFDLNYHLFEKEDDK